MIVIKSVNSVFFDVDDTLILWSPTSEQLADEGIDITCPGTLHSGPDGDIVEIGEWTQRVVPYTPNIEAMKRHKLRGHRVIVWSAGGWDWAEAAVKALGLEHIVDVVMSKPHWCYDDLPPNEYMPKSLFVKK